MCAVPLHCVVSVCVGVGVIGKGYIRASRRASLMLFPLFWMTVTGGVVTGLCIVRV